MRMRTRNDKVKDSLIDFGYDLSSFIVGVAGGAALAPFSIRQSLEMNRKRYIPRWLSPINVGKVVGMGLAAYLISEQQGTVVDLLAITNLLSAGGEVVRFVDRKIKGKAYLDSRVEPQ